MRKQKGYIFKRGSTWFLRYYDNVVRENGAVERVQFCKRLAPVCDEYRQESDVKQLAQDILEPVNTVTLGPSSAMPVVQFVEQVFFPGYVEKELHASTARGYRDLWKRFLRSRVGVLKLREVETHHITKILASILATDNPRNNALKNMKSFLSAVFRHAISEGYMPKNTVNPVREAKISRHARKPIETFAYTIAEVEAMLAVLGEPAHTIVTTAALTGLRKSELCGLQWQDFHGDTLQVQRAVWNGRIDETKTAASNATIPLMPQVADALNEHRKRLGILAQPTSPIFQADNGAPLNLDNLAYRVIVPALKGAGVEWHGWHAFRRGLATNLNALGIADKTTSTILRHSDVATTQKAYIKPVDETQRSGLSLLSAEIQKQRDENARIMQQRVSGQVN
jgi:integrase